MSPTIHYKTVINEYITTGIVMGYSVFYLKCSCNNIISFQFSYKRSSSIYCDKCNRLAYDLIYNNKFEIIIRRYFDDSFEDYPLKNNARNRLKTRVKRQHELSKMYLKNFCLLSSKKIFVYNKRYDSSEDHNIQSFSRRPFLYDKEPPQLTEEYLSLIENDTSPYLSMVIKNNKIFSPGDSPESKDYKRTLLLRFMILIHLRRRAIKKIIYNKLLQFNSQESEKLILNNIEFESKFRMIDENGRKIYNNLVQHIHRLLIRAAFNQEKLYNDYRIQLLINNSSIPFITSDNPVIKINGIKRNNLTIPSKIYFPISLKHYLLFTHPDVNHISIEEHLKESEVHRLNYWQYLCSTKFIISNLHSTREYIKKFIEVPISFINIPLCFFGFKSNFSNQELSLFI